MILSIVSNLRYGRNITSLYFLVLSCKHPVIFLSLAVALTSLTACANSPIAKNLEQSLAADPRLKNNSVVFGKTQNQEPQAQATAKIQLPANFPKNIPIYPNSTLEEVKPASNSETGTSTRWQSYDPSNFITSYYRSQLTTNKWQISQQPS